MAVSICSSGVSGGSKEVAARASRVLPEPGGPEMRMLWWPAIAIIRARLARSWPRICSNGIASGQLDFGMLGLGMF